MSAAPSRARPRPSTLATASAELTPSLLVDAFVEQLAAKVAERLGGVGGEYSGRYYDARSAPECLGRRAFLDAAARGEFPSFRLGNRVVARVEDVHRWIEARPVVTRPPQARARRRSAREAEDAADDLLLRGAGLRPAPASLERTVSGGGR